MKEITLELSREALQLAAQARPLFPGLTDPEIAVELLLRGLKAGGKEVLHGEVE